MSVIVLEWLHVHILKIRPPNYYLIIPDQGSSCTLSLLINSGAILNLGIRTRVLSFSVIHRLVFLSLCSASHIRHPSSDKQFSAFWSKLQTKYLYLNIAWVHTELWKDSYLNFSELLSSTMSNQKFPRYDRSILSIDSLFWVIHFELNFMMPIHVNTLKVRCKECILVYTTTFYFFRETPYSSLITKAWLYSHVLFY